MSTIEEKFLEAIKLSKEVNSSVNELDSLLAEINVELKSAGLRLYFDTFDKSSTMSNNDDSWSNSGCSF